MRSTRRRCWRERFPGYRTKHYPGHAVLIAADSRRRSRHHRTAMATGRADENVDDHGGRACPHHLREQDRASDWTMAAPPRSRAPTDKDAFVMAHESAAEYINDDTKSFMDRYSDMLYLGAAALSVIGSIFAGALRQGHPDRTGTGQRAHHSDPRHRPEDRARAFAGRA
jgi:hypothetical protein